MLTNVDEWHKYDTMVFVKFVNPIVNIRDYNEFK